MSKFGQVGKIEETAVLEASGDRTSPITTFTRDYPAGHIVKLHFHDKDQLVYASRGVMTVRTTRGTWTVPTHRAVWIAAAVPHSITMSGAVAMRTLYFRPRLVARLPRSCCVVNVSPLLRELILHACDCGTLKRTRPWQRHLIDVIIDQLQVVSMVPLQLPHLADERALKIAKLLATNPSERRTLTELCKLTGAASSRTMERLFQQNTGMTFGRWRHQFRLMHALRLLAEGAKVTYAALEAGYSTPSAFICMFKKSIGITPGTYFRARETAHPETEKRR